MFLHALKQFELRFRAYQVMFRILNLIICIAVDIIGKEAYALHIGEQGGRIGQVLCFCRSRKDLALTPDEPFVNALNISISKFTFARSLSSSSPVLAPERRKSPKSEKTKLGITVSRSMTQRTLPFSSNIILLTFVSQWQTRLGSLPSRCRRSALHISSARRSISSRKYRTSFTRPAASAATASRSCFRRNSILWKSGIVSPSSSGISASMAWKLPKLHLHNTNIRGRPFRMFWHWE